MNYEYWKFQQLEPDLSEIKTGRKYKVQTPTWIEKLNFEKKMRQEMGEEKYFKMLEEYDKRKTEND